MYLYLSVNSVFVCALNVTRKTASVCVLLYGTKLQVEGGRMMLSPEFHKVWPFLDISKTRP